MNGINVLMRQFDQCLDNQIRRINQIYSFYHIIIHDKIIL